MDILAILDAEEAQRVSAGKTIPDFQPGDTVVVNVKVKEGERSRVQAYEGVVIARTGGGTEDSSGDIFIAFATGNDGLPPADYANKGAFTTPLRMVNNDYISALFAAAAEAVEEAIVNALLAANTVSGNGHRAEGLSAEQLVTALEKAGWRR